MTAYVALKYGNLDDMVTISERATDFAEDEQVCGLQAGDQLSLRDLLNGLLLYSGNDCAVAIAEHVSGSVEAFVDKMNEEARNLGATGTHFVNPHGLQNEDHYTTAYDLYLMFNACLQNPQFVEMISQTSYTGESYIGIRSTVYDDLGAYQLLCIRRRCSAGRSQGDWREDRDNG